VRLIKILLALTTSCVFLVWWFTHELPASLAQDFLALPLTVVIAAVLGLFLSYALRGWRVCREFKEFPKMRFGAALQVVLWHNASVNVMPFRSGEAAFPWLLNRRFDISITRATASLLWLRIQDACVVLMLGIWVLADIDLITRVLLSCGLVVAALIFAKWSRISPPTPITQWPWKYLNGFRQALSESHAHSPEGWWVTLANWLIKLSVQAMLFAALLQSSFQTGLAGTFGAELAAVTPLQGVAGIGSYEAASAAAMLPWGVEWSVGLRTALVVHLVVLTCALSCAAVAGLIATFRPTLPPDIAT
jgi:hypothetical protein